MPYGVLSPDDASGTVTMHRPALHCAVDGAAAEQTVPQPPQFWSSLAVSTHLPPHSVSEPGHPQEPLWHTPPTAHALPHPLQLATFVSVSTHMPPQLTSE